MSLKTEILSFLSDNPKASLNEVCERFPEQKRGTIRGRLSEIRNGKIPSYLLEWQNSQK